MVYYLNIGFILEQALVDVVKRYLDQINVDDVYDNFHISVVNEHPFAHMIVDDHAKCADNFPSVVITSQDDSKPSELSNVPAQTCVIGLTSEDIDLLINSTKRNKTKIDKDGEVINVIKKGEIQKENIPGMVCVYDEERIQKIKEVADSRTTETESGMVYGIKSVTRCKDKISVEIWAENNQLKNELYEILRDYFKLSLDRDLSNKYPIFDTNIFESSINGERSNNYNYDFDAILCGSHISFDVDYNIAQYIIDTDIQNWNPEQIILEVKNHVKRYWNERFSRKN